MLSSTPSQRNLRAARTQPAWPASDPHPGGVHSGLACGAARGVQSALAAMHGGAPGTAATRSGAPRRIVPAIVFHGDRDSTVNPRNADAVVAQSAQAAALSKGVEQGRASGGHAYSRTLSTDAAGQTVIEQWVVHGAGH